MSNDMLKRYYIPKAQQMGIEPNTIWDSVAVPDPQYRKTVIVTDFNHNTLQIKVKIIGCSDEELINEIEECYIGTFIHAYKPYEE
jgi:hypothetical protein